MKIAKEEKKTKNDLFAIYLLKTGSILITITYFLYDYFLHCNKSKFN
jgi:hypothetical protein